jgi:hypothetical protein
MKADGVVRNHLPVESRDRCLRRRPRASCRKPARRYLIRLPRGKEEPSALKRYTTNQRSASSVRRYRCGKMIDPHEYCRAAIPTHDVRDNTRKRNPPRYDGFPQSRRIGLGLAHSDAESRLQAAPKKRLQRGNHQTGLRDKHAANSRHVILLWLARRRPWLYEVAYPEKHKLRQSSRCAGEARTRERGACEIRRGFRARAKLGRVEGPARSARKARRLI